MKSILKIKVGLLAILATSLLFSACNKGVEDITGNPPVPPVNPSSVKAIADSVKSTPNYSFYSAIIVKSGLTATLNNKSSNFTAFVPTNAAVKQLINGLSGGLIPLAAPDATFLGFINGASFTAASAAGIVSYYTLGQVLPSSGFPATFPNLQAPTLLNPAPTLSALLRLNIYPSSRNGFYINNIPISAADKIVGNGIIHEIPAPLVPPQQYLWDRINAATNLTYLKAAIARADSGTAAPGFLRGALLNIGANLTVFAPTDAAFTATLTGLITQALVAQGVPLATAQAQAAFLASTPAVFSNPALYSSLTAKTVQGILVYHLMGTRAFANNFPTTQSNFPTLLNGAIAAHPGVGLRATFTGPSVSAATVKGLGNATAANISINPTPAPGGSSDQNYLNGALHIIDQVLIPQ